MPIYEYQNLKTGQVELHFNSVARRDCMGPHLRRIQVPSGVGFCGLACAPRQSSEVMAGFKAVEEKFGINEIRRQTGLSAEKIKEVWTEGYHPEDRVNGKQQHEEQPA
jgi:hypothetical protein